MRYEAEMNVFIMLGNWRSHLSELQHHIKPGIYSLRGKQSRLVHTKVCSDREATEISFVSQRRKMPCDTHSLSVLTDGHYAAE